MFLWSIKPSFFRIIQEKSDFFSANIVTWKSKPKRENKQKESFWILFFLWITRQQLDISLPHFVVGSDLKGV